MWDMKLVVGEWVGGGGLPHCAIMKNMGTKTAREGFLLMEFICSFERKLRASFMSVTS